MMTDNERAVIEAAVEWGHFVHIRGFKSVDVKSVSERLMDAIKELHNEHDGKWRPSDD